MAITYPLSLPSHTRIRSVEMRATNAVAVERSPFTFASQVQASAGQMWQADISLPPMKYADAEQWIGAASSATLHKVLADVNTNGSGQATLLLWPHIRTAPANNATVVVTNTVGRWRLASNESSWSVNEASIYGISFSCMEAIG